MARNVLVVCLDSVRQDYFREFAPRIADYGTLVPQARAASSWSSPSHASMFTGQLPHRHGVHVGNRQFDGIDREDTVLGDLPDHSAVGVSANVFASSNFGFDRWFDTFHDVSTGRRFAAGLDPNAFYLDADAEGIRKYSAFLRAAVGSEAPLASLANGVLAALNVVTRELPLPKLLDDGAAVVNRTLDRSLAATSEPWVGFANYGDAHIPLRPVRGYDRDLYSAPPDWSTDSADVWDVIEAPEAHETYLTYHRELYGAAIDYMDRRLVELIERLRAKTARDTTVIITADHGENLGFPADDRLIGHKSSLSEGLLHVPLAVINPPSGWRPPTKYFSHLDLRALIAGFAADEAPALGRDRIPAEVLGMSPGPDPLKDPDYWDRALRGVYEADSKVVWDSQGQCIEYELDTDRPCWQRRRNEPATVPAWADEWFEVDIEAAKRAVASAAAPTEVDAATEQRLEDLGYM